MRIATVSYQQPSVAGRGRQRESLPPPEQIDVHVGRQLRDRRKQLGISQGRLGRHLGITFSQIQKYENGSNRIGAGRLYHFAAILGVPVQYFFDELGQAEEAARSSSEAAGASDAGKMQDLFARIPDPDARRALLSLVASMAGK